MRLVATLLLFFLTLVVFSEEEKETPGVDAFVFLLRVFGVTTCSIIVYISTFLTGKLRPSSTVLNSSPKFES